MYENVVFAILALCFIVLAQRQREHLIPLLTIVYRAGFILCIVMAITQSFSVQQTYTTFSYNVSGVNTANSIYSYSNMLTSQSNNDAIAVVFGIIMVFAIIIEIIEESLIKTPDKMGRRLISDR
jgi:hypothetical protein